MNDTRLLKRSSLDAMFAPARVNDGSTTLSGLGWWLNPVRGRPAATHGGAFRTGFNSAINRYVDENLTVIVLANLFRVGAHDAAHVVAGFYDPAFRSISSMNVKPDSEPNRTADLKNLLIRLGEGSVNLDELSESFPYRAYEPGDWEQLIRGMRTLSFIKCEPVPRKGSNTFAAKIDQICFYKIRTQTDDRYFSVTTEIGGKIAYIEPYEY